jgi:NADPH:quinone reductase-like Zn-dependent oxidoreductase
VIRASALSMFCGPRLRGMLARSNKADLRTLAQMIEAGSLRPVVGATYPLAQVADALRLLEQGHARGKIAVTI